MHVCLKAGMGRSAFDGRGVTAEICKALRLVDLWKHGTVSAHISGGLFRGGKKPRPPFFFIYSVRVCESD